MSERCGRESDYRTFSSAQPRVIRTSPAGFVTNASESQVRAWDDSIPLLQDGARHAPAAPAQAKAYTAILENRLPLETRRPVVILLESGAVVVIEFKGKEHGRQGRSAHTLVRDTLVRDMAIRPYSMYTIRQRGRLRVG